MGVARLKSTGQPLNVTTRDSSGKIISAFSFRPSSFVPQPSPPPLPEPTLADMASHLGGALIKWAARGFPIADHETRQRRLRLCRACPHWDESARANMGKCNHPKCGCTKIKLAIATERCPINKW